MKQSKDRRVINIPKTDYDILKKYCDELTLDMPKWMVKNSKEKIQGSSLDEDTFFTEVRSDDPIDFIRKLKAYQNTGKIIEKIFINEELEMWNKDYTEKIPYKGFTALLLTRIPK